MDQTLREYLAHLVDFIIVAHSFGKARGLVALETNGDHLQNPDTNNKRHLLSFLSGNFDWDNAVTAGQLKLENSGETVECALILMVDITTGRPII